GLGVPEADRLGGGGDALAVPRERERDFARVPGLPVTQLLAGRGIPKVDDAGPGNGREVLAVLAERQAVEARLRIVAGEQFLAGGGLEDADGVVEAGGGDALAVLAQGEGVGVAPVTGND